MDPESHRFWLIHMQAVGGGGGRPQYSTILTADFCCLLQTGGWGYRIQSICQPPSSKEPRSSGRLGSTSTSCRAFSGTSLLRSAAKLGRSFASTLLGLFGWDGREGVIVCCTHLWVSPFFEGPSPAEKEWVAFLTAFV